MSLSPQKQIQNGAIGIQPPSSPSAIVFKDYLYIFYIGAGGDGIWYTWSYYSLLRGRQFTAPIQVSARAGTPIPIAPATRPVPVVFNNTLYLFFTALGEKGFSLSLTTSKDGSRWTPAVDVSGAIPGALPVMPATNPAATVHKGHLYLFWCTPSTAPPDRNVNRLQFSELENGKWVGANDVPAVNLGVRPYTSPAVVDFRGQLLVFYDGSGGDGTWVTSYNGGYGRL
ncbi:uncharacterized protein KY384_006750 [Bacidia gigantensis]|uniref:uncharacterized protein n=1 Tax=Bacidia gigantensis TaxID=2732470 RepID=UPI001D056F8F|nr:uncharacterized protein KY384_006750 [Bacidia gigantensis]KAG8527834.1 hypothetical protein KY384_006750 [Bacidia gigantensis]